MVAPISTYGAYGISSMSAFSPLTRAQGVDPVITQDIKDASTVAKTATSLSNRVEAIRPNAKDDSTWAYVQSQNIGLPQALDIEGLEQNDSKIVIDLKGFNIPESFEFQTPEQSLEKNFKEMEEEVTIDVAQEYVSKFAEYTDDNLVIPQIEKDDKNETVESFDNFFANQFFGLNSYAQNSKIYEECQNQISSYVA